MNGVLQREIWGQQLARWVAFLKEGGVSQAELAQALGVHTSTISQWKRGRGEPEASADRLMSMLRRHKIPAMAEEALDWWALLGYYPSEEKIKHWYPKWEPPKRIDLLAQTFPLPDSYIVRETEMARVIGMLLKERAFRKPANKRVVLWGMGGVGKTILAKAVALDEDVERYFRSGVLWAELGPEGDARHWLERWCKLLGLPVRGDETVWELHQRVREFLSAAERRFLLVVDDVWRAEDLEPLLVDGPQSRVLITLREKHLVQELGWDGCFVEVDVMSGSEAVDLMRLRLGECRQEKDVERALDLVLQVEKLPLAVQLGAVLVKRRGWKYVLEQVGKERRRLNALRLGGIGERAKRRALVRLLLRLHSEPLPGDLQQYFAGWEVCAGPKLEAQTRLPSRDLYVTRPELEGFIERHLLTGEEGEHHVLMYGLRGRGVTTVSKFAAMEIEGIAPLTGGVLWADLGMEGVFARDWLKEWAAQLGIATDGGSVEENAVRAADYLSKPERRVLIVLDDVQDVEKAERLLIGGHHCRYLLTSLSAKVGRGLERPFQDCEVKSMTVAEGVELIERIVGEEGLSWSREVVKALGGYPLALSMVAHLAKSRGAEYILDRLRKRDDYFDALLTEGEPSVVHVLHEVYRGLSAGCVTCLHQLAVSARSAELSTEQIAGMLDQEILVVEDLLWQLSEVGLVEQEAREGQRYWRLQPIVADWVRQEVPEAELAEARDRQVSYHGLALLKAGWEGDRFADFSFLSDPKWFEPGEGRFYWKRDGLSWLANFRVGWEWAARLGERGQVWRVLYYLGALGGSLDYGTVREWQDQALAAAQRAGSVAEAARLSLLSVLYWLRWERRNPNLLAHTQQAWSRAQQFCASYDRVDDVLYSSLQLTVDKQFSSEQLRDVEGALRERSELDAEAVRLLYLLGWLYDGAGMDERAQECFQEASRRFRRQGRWGGMVLAVMSYSDAGQAGLAEIGRIVSREKEQRVRRGEEKGVRGLEALAQAVASGDLDRVAVSERAALAVVFEGEWRRRVKAWWQRLEKCGNKGRCFP